MQHSARRSVGLTMRAPSSELSWRELVLAECARMVSLLRRYPKWGDIPNYSSAAIDTDGSDRLAIMGDFGRRMGLRVSVKDDDAVSVRSFEKGHRRGASTSSLSSGRQG